MSAQTAESTDTSIMDAPNATSILSLAGIAIANVIEQDAYGMSTNVL